MSWQEWFTFNARTQARQIAVPTLFAHSQQAAIPQGTSQFFADITAPKEFIWMEGTKFDFYDQPATVGAAVEASVRHLRPVLERP